MDGARLRSGIDPFPRSDSDGGIGTLGEAEKKRVEKARKPIPVVEGCKWPMGLHVAQLSSVPKEKFVTLALIPSRLPAWETGDSQREQQDSRGFRSVTGMRATQK
ncbi:hypothetical protein AMTR_s00030p00119510 [Amborella trichopoda]|uniref:Uncharacterized protein n=1 Tax=Amborella trichopoda TaxID=13333 RepID=U5D6T9_AMBTC|nr:hypothetical protein AMTR_s00030p00119510 [Amborella trichopoda]